MACCSIRPMLTFALLAMIAACLAAPGLASPSKDLAPFGSPASVEEYIDFLYHYMHSVNRPRFGKRAVGHSSYGIPMTAFNSLPHIRQFWLTVSYRPSHTISQAEADWYLGELTRYLQLVVGRPRFG